MSVHKNTYTQSIPIVKVVSERRDPIFFNMNNQINAYLIFDKDIALQKFCSFFVFSTVLVVLIST